MTSTTANSKPHASPPLPLQDIASWVSSSCLVHNKNTGGGSQKQSNNTAASQHTTVLEWLREGDAQAAAWKEELEANGADQIVNLFAVNNNLNDGDGDDEDASDASVDSNVDFEGVYGRIRVWQSSKDNVDGVGSKFRGEERGDGATSDNEDGVKVTYLISEAWEGYGLSSKNLP